MDENRTTYDHNKCPYYHFTDFDALEKIIDENRLRLTPCDSAKNAPVETMALYSALKSILENNSDIRQRLMSEYECDSENILIQKIIEQREKSYMACFTILNLSSNENEDDEISKLDYMWKFYADQGRGIVIKFYYECFPYQQCGSSSGLNEDDQKRLSEIGIGDVIYNKERLKEVIKDNLRLSEIRIDDVIYNEARLEKLIDAPCDTHLFATDMYKPKFCELENEKRFLVYLSSENDVDKLERISASKDTRKNSKFPKYLYYNFCRVDEHESCSKCIERIFCIDPDTKKKLDDLMKTKQTDVEIVLINNH